MNLIKLPGPRFIILENVNMVDFSIGSETCCINWATGDAPLKLEGAEAVGFITALEQLTQIDFGHFALLEARDVLDDEDDDNRPW
jgi:hypothetical protein